ncbi:11321_t:CDS:2, partial [Entrophospora sp. SA101]
TENIKRIIKDAYRRDLFVKEKYPQDVVIEKFTRQTLMNNFPDDERYSEREKWDVVWFTLRGPSLELFRIIRGNAVRRIKTTLFQKFKKLEAINNDASMNQILEWKNKKPTRDVLLLLNEIEEDEDRTYLEVITRLAFSHDKGKVNGTNKSFVWAIINGFISADNDSLHLDETVIIPLMEKYQREVDGDSHNIDVKLEF